MTYAASLIVLHETFFAGMLLQVVLEFRFLRKRLQNFAVLMATEENYKNQGKKMLGDLVVHHMSLYE